MELNGPGNKSLELGKTIVPTIYIIYMEGRTPLVERLESCKGRVIVLLVSVVVAEAPDVVGGNVMDGAQHVVPVLHL